MRAKSLREAFGSHSRAVRTAEKIFHFNACFGEPAGEPEETVWVKPGAEIKTGPPPGKCPGRPKRHFPADTENTLGGNSEGAVSHFSYQTCNLGLLCHTLPEVGCEALFSLLKNIIVHDFA